MAFRFSLQAVLQFRKSLEHQHELRLRAANQQVARVRRLGEQIDARIEQLRIGQSQALGFGTTAAELRFTGLCEEVLTQHRIEINHELARVEALRDEQQEIFQQARRQRETIESLRDRQLREYNRDAARREQRGLDDLFLLRASYLRRS